METHARVALGFFLSVLSLVAPAALAENGVTAAKSVSGSFVQGTSVTYTVVMTNNMAIAQNDNSGPEFTDDFPPELTVDSVSATGGTIASSGNSVAWDGSLAPGESVTMTIVATIGPAATGVIWNQGQTSFDTDADGRNDSSSVTDDPSTEAANDATSFMVLQWGIVSAAKSVSGSFVQGTDVTYTIVMTNNMTIAQGDNYSHEFTDALPDGLTIAGVSASSGTIVNFDNVVLWDGTLAPGESVTMTVVATIGLSASGTISNEGQTIFDRDGDNLHNESSQVTDDPSTEAGWDATSFEVVELSTGVFEFSAASYDAGESTGSFDVTVNRTGGSVGAAEVAYVIAAGTAQAEDFDAGGGTLTFADGETSKTFPVTIAGDAIDESGQTIALSLGNPTNGTTLGAQNTATIVIQDDDAPPVFSIDDVTLTEGNSGTQQATFTITKTGETELTATIWVNPSAGTASCCGVDYSGPNSGLTFSPGTTTRTAQLAVFGDLVHEEDETVFMDLADAVNATIGDGQGVLTIVNDDPVPAIAINDLSVDEGNSGVKQVSLTVTLSNATSQTVTLDWTLDAGTATCCGNDFSGPSGSMTFQPGMTTRTISATIFGDTTYEPDETVLVNLTSSTNSTIGDDQGVITIVNDDAVPAITINDLSIEEGNSGTRQATLTATLSNASSEAVTLDWTLDAGTATCCGNDFSGPHGSTTFQPGMTTRTISATIFGDTTYESDETVLVNLTSSTNATIGDDQGVITIVNDDAVPAITINDLSIEEGNSGTRQATLTATLSNASSEAVTLDWTLDAGTATCCGNDFSGPHGSTTFQPGMTTRTINATIFGDTTHEPDETVLVNLTSSTNATIGDDQGVITIVNDDAVPAIAINDLSVDEGNSGIKQVSLTVTLTGTSSQDITFDWTIDAGTASCCAVDYSGPNGSSTFPAGGPTTRTITVAIFADTTWEPDETAFVNLTSATNATIADAQGVITIVNDDAVPNLTINDVSVTEGDSGTSQATLTVTLNGSTSQTVTVDWTLDAGTATCCGNDFSGPHGTLTFPPGTTARTISATIFGDTTYEPDETILVNLANAVNATIGDAQGVITILNDDSPQADLSLTMSYAPSIPGPSDTITYTTVVSNSGPLTATNVIVSDDWPNDAAFKSVSTTQGSCTTADPVVCSMGSLASGASATITLVVKAPSSYDSLTNIATAASDLADPTPAIASATVACMKESGKSGLRPCKN